MKNLKRLIALILALTALFALTACGDKANNDNSGTAANTGSDNTQAADNPYNLDYTSADLQPMTDKRADKDTLAAAGDYYMDGLANDAANFSKMTYKDMAEYIGTDASEFQYFESWGQYRYTWYVEGSSGASLLAVFDTNGNLFSVTSSVG